MNAERRKGLDDVLAKLEEARAALESVKDGEDEAYSNLPENVQSGERGEKMQEAVTTLEDAMEDISSAVEKVENAKE